MDGETLREIYTIFKHSLAWPPEANLQIVDKNIHRNIMKKDI